ncbi:cache and HAMP domain-containing protein [Cypionkella sp.]|uniref:cache domain-containing protein n=1 Tax=Cypionkella sp. TaxID=2811411 RepID=UPI002ABA3215|nr:cache and HAMP domain-containing protein [Cypionkella sp.]MDZ4394064.1 cache and HAMP domain-containing protein [Cypionkella sp.]
MTSRRSSTISLAAAVYGFVFLGAILFALATTFLLLDRIARVESAALEEAVAVRGRHAARDLARGLEQDWRELKAIADNISGTDGFALESALDLTAAKDARISWAGLATPEGIVLEASNDLLKNVDVSSRPWFQRGLGGDFAGDVHEAILLNKLLAGPTDDPLRFIDLASQVKGQDGQIVGVLGFHINFEWVETFLAETADGLGLDIYLVSQNGDVIIATDGSKPGARDLQSFRAAATGVEQSSLETWPDGVDYYTVVIPDVTYGELPSFGWRMVARINPDEFDTTSSGLTSALILLMSVAGLMLLILTAAFNRIFVHPFSLLADNAKRIADGADDYPLELHRTDELQRLSAALAQLQGRRH